MIVFNEGLPGAGKSYDAVVTHILPALKAGRHVYARLNGLDPDAIAAYLQMPASGVVALLHPVAAEEVAGLSEVVVQDSLVVIDECHEFYVASREPLSKTQEAFFAMHRHRGLDIVLISQFYKRVHSAVRARIEQKNLYRKMTAVGMNSRYVVQYSAAIAPDKFEKTGSEIRKYDPAIFALYQSVQTGTENLAVYAQGTRKVWQGSFAYISVAMVIAVIVGAWVFISFFTGDTKLVKDKPEARRALIATGATPITAKAEPGAADHAKPAIVEKPRREPAVQYVLDLSGQARPRVGATIFMADGRTAGLVEWVDTNGRVLERLSYAQLRAMGWTVVATPYGVQCRSGPDEWIATIWPRDIEFRYAGTEASRERLQAPARPMPSVSEPSAVPVAQLSPSRDMGGQSRGLNDYDPSVFSRR